MHKPIQNSKLSHMQIEHNSVRLSCLHGKEPKRKALHKAFEVEKPKAVQNNLLLLSFPHNLIFKCRGLPIVCSSLIMVAFDYEKCNPKDSTLRTWQKGSMPTP